MTGTRHGASEEPAGLSKHRSSVREEDSTTRGRAAESSAEEGRGEGGSGAHSIDASLPRGSHRPAASQSSPRLRYPPVRCCTSRRKACRIDTFHHMLSPGSRRRLLTTKLRSTNDFTTNTQISESSPPRQASPSCHPKPLSPTNFRLGRSCAL